MTIEPLPVPSVPGDFGAIVRDDRLALPVDVARGLAALSIKTAEELLSYLQTFPTAVARQLGWSVDDLDRAVDQLVVALEGHVDVRVLHPEAPVEHGLGALDPASLRR